jgi:hypothetical protein
MRATKLHELEEMATMLQATASKLPSGPERHDIVQEIERFRAKIAAAWLPFTGRRTEG